MLTIHLLLAIVSQAVSPESRGIAYLAAEVPRWSKENHCFSCHNDGDGARILYLAARKGLPVPAGALDSTSRWLSTPRDWPKNGGDGPFNDRQLARIQFTVALATGVESGRISDREPILTAARQLADDQSADGSWETEDRRPIASPTTYGRALATFLAANALKFADDRSFRGEIDRAEAWLGRLKPENVDDSAIIVLSTAGKTGDRDVARRREAIERIRDAESPDGGWGPFLRSPVETFDTALVVIALAQVRQEPGISERIARGRSALIAWQLADGSWTETTRPSGGESYAQRISTTAWATQALLESRPNRP